MTCREILDFLMAYLDGELSPEVRAEFDRHLAVCPACVNYLASYRQTLELERQSFDPGATEPGLSEVPEDLVRAILASRKR